MNSNVPFSILIDNRRQYTVKTVPPFPLGGRLYSFYWGKNNLFEMEKQSFSTCVGKVLSPSWGNTDCFLTECSTFLAGWIQSSQPLIWIGKSSTTKKVINFCNDFGIRSPIYQDCFFVTHTGTPQLFLPFSWSKSVAVCKHDNQIKIQLNVKELTSLQIIRMAVHSRRI